MAASDALSPSAWALGIRISGVIDITGRGGAEAADPSPAFVVSRVAKGAVRERGIASSSRRIADIDRAFVPI